MPELPEVEFARRCLMRWLGGHEVLRAEAEPGVRTFRGSDPREFERVHGKLESATRRGKYLMLTFGDGHGVLAHLGMTGKFVRRSGETTEPYSRARLVLDDGSVIHFRDPRLFGRLEVVPAGELPALEVVRNLGLDPVVDGLDGASLRERLEGTRQDLKVALMDQALVAGLGNIHAAEALYLSRIHPSRKPATLSSKEWDRLAGAVQQTIEQALGWEDGEEIEYVEEGGENPFRVYGRAGERCPRCGKTIESFTQSGRTTHFCPGCQPRKPRS